MMLEENSETTEEQMHGVASRRSGLVRVGFLSVAVLVVGGVALLARGGLGARATVVQKTNAVTVLADHTCPAGYGATDFDIANYGGGDLVDLIASLEDCGKECDKDEACKGFEFNNAAKHCWTSHLGHFPEVNQHPSWESCIKDGVDIKSDGPEEEE